MAAVERVDQDDLPGAEFLIQGLADLAAGVFSEDALLVAIGAPRLRRVGVAVPPDDVLPPEPEHSLYRLLATRSEKGAHSAYNALIRRLVSLEHALEFRRGRARRLAEKQVSDLARSPPGADPGAPPATT